MIAPAVGTLALPRVGRDRFGDMWLPYSIQTEAGRRGSFTDPVDTIGDALPRASVDGDTVGTGLHVPWLVLVVVLRRGLLPDRGPVSYGASRRRVASPRAVVSSNLDSFERYALGAFPLVLVAASLTSSRRVERAVLVLSGCGDDAVRAARVPPRVRAVSAGVSRSRSA